MDSGVRTRRTSHDNIEEIEHLAFVSTLEPKAINEALEDSDWIIAMHDELNQFERNKVCKLVPRSKDISTIGTKWGFRNKLDEKGQII